MSELYKRIEELAKNNGLTVNALRLKAGVSQTTLSELKSGRTQDLSRKTAQKLADVLGITVDDLYGVSSVSGKAKANSCDLCKTIKVLGKVPAGIPVEAIEYVVDEIDLTPALFNDSYEYFALLVTGNSMYPEYLDGDVVVVRKQSTAETGDDVVAFIGSCDATLKRLQKYQNSIRLKALNPEYESFTYTIEEIESLPVVIIGTVVELRRKKK